MVTSEEYVTFVTVNHTISKLLLRGEIIGPFDESVQEESARKDLDHKLANVPLFSYLTADERQKIAEYLSPLSVRKGTTIIHEGEIGDCMYLIKSGEVGV